MQHALATADVVETQRCYERLKLYSGLLTDHNVRSVTVMLSQCLHRGQLHLNQEVRTFVAQIVSDLYNKQIPSPRLAFPPLLEILAILNETEALQNLWTWLLKQDAEHLSPQAYGAVMKIASAAGQPLEVMEDLYQQALEQFPGDYAAYHMSPNAIIKHREQMTSIKGSSGHLLEAIARARFARGHRRRAYLDLDTALRLRPDQLRDTFCFEFMIATTPIEQRYILFQLNCTNHTLLRHGIFTTMLDDLASQAFMGTPQRELAVAHAQVELLSAAVGTGRIRGRQLLERCCQLALRLAVLAHVAGSGFNVTSGTISILDKIFAAAVTSSSTAQFSPVKTVIATAGQLRCRALFEAGLRYYATATKVGADVARDPIIYHTILKAAGLLNETTIVKSAWKDLVELQQVAPQQKSAWIVLARACRETDMGDFLHAELLTANVPEDSPVRAAALRELDKPKERSTPTEEHDVAADDISNESELSELTTKLDAACTLLHTGGTRNFKRDPARMLLGAPHIRASEADMHAVYDHLTADARASLPADDSGAKEQMPWSSSPILSCGYRIDELRYGNWKTINELLAQSALHDGDNLGGVASLFDSAEPLTQPQLLQLLVKLRGINEEELRVRAGPRMTNLEAAAFESSAIEGNKLPSTT